MAERHYRPGVEGLVVNGGVASFDDPGAWAAYRDLLS